VFSEIYQGETDPRCYCREASCWTIFNSFALRLGNVSISSESSRVTLLSHHASSLFPLNEHERKLTFFFSIVTGPVARFARQIASQGYIVAAPSSYHEFTGPEALAYDGPGTDKGNEWKITKTVEAYDEDATLSIDTLLALETCNGRVGATGTCPSL
jgi:hypothetical protein